VTGRERPAVIFGAGNIGRGFLGQLFFNAGYRTCFVEARPELAALLNERGAYPLWIVSDAETRRYRISNLAALPVGSIDRVAAALADADLAATAVGVNNLARVAPGLAAGIALRAERGRPDPLNIIICENLLAAAGLLAAEIRRHLPPACIPYFQERVGLVETVVSRMVPPVPADLLAREPLLVLVEPYQVLPVARQAFKGDRLPEVAGFLPVDDIHAYEEQKLYIHNLGHAVCAYYGYLKGYRYIWEAVRDPEIRDRLDRVLAEAGGALTRKHPFLSGQLEGYIADLRERFGNRALGDTVFRVGREPLRKLGPNDRLIGALRLCLEQQVEFEDLARAVAAALAYDYPEDPEAVELAGLIAAGGPGRVLHEVCGLKPDSPVYRAVETAYVRLAAARPGK